jgi:hypothetical protein
MADQVPMGLEAVHIADAMRVPCAPAAGAAARCLWRDARLRRDLHAGHSASAAARAAGAAGRRPGTADPRGPPELRGARPGKGCCISPLVSTTRFHKLHTSFQRKSPVWSARTRRHHRARPWPRRLDIVGSQPPYPASGEPESPHRQSSGRNSARGPQAARWPLGDGGSDASCPSVACGLTRLANAGTQSRLSESNVRVHWQPRDPRADNFEPEAQGLFRVSLPAGQWPRPVRVRLAGWPRPAASAGSGSARSGGIRHSRRLGFPRGDSGSGPGLSAQNAA